MPCPYLLPNAHLAPREVEPPRSRSQVKAGNELVEAPQGLTTGARSLLIETRFVLIGAVARRDRAIATQSFYDRRGFHWVVTNI